MADLNDRVLDEAEGRGEAFSVENLITLVERHEADPEPGVPADRLREYAEHLEGHGGPMSVDQVDAALELHRTDAESWQGPDALYEVGDGRVSLYPASWYDRLEGETDPARYLEVILEDVDDSRSAFATGGAGKGVPENVLLNVATVIGGVSWRDAAAELQALGDEGIVVADAEQHPNARIRLTEKYFDDR
ncbi:hypothetical protein [Halegenticoccus soli]|uniref:hypothetical protein n=1 Tax=Halegenticoccus soli TaxID=1985678 RepID=UPI000C6E5D2D|nr:hypothetical protein [Halegenticoccus soli]